MTEGKHLPGEHNQETHGHRFSRRPGRLLMRSIDTPKRPEAPKPRTRLPLAAVTSPTVAARQRQREKAGLAPRRPRVVTLPDAATDEPDELERDRDAATPVGAVEPIPPLDTLDDDQLAEWFTIAAERDDQDAVERIVEELEERQKADEAWGSPKEQADFLDRAAGRKPRSEKEQAEDAYVDWYHAQYLRATEDVGTFLVSRAGQAAGVDGLDLFTGRYQRSEIGKYASPELIEWFARPGNQRLTKTEFVREWLGKATVADRQGTARGFGEF